MCSGVSQPEGKKLLRSLVVWRWILLYPLPDGSRVNRPWLGRVLSYVYAGLCSVSENCTTSKRTTIIVKNNDPLLPNCTL